MAQEKSEHREELKILIIDDSSFTRRSISKIIEKTPHQIVGEAGSLPEVTKIMGSSIVNTILIDIIMPDINGAELARQVRESYSKMNVILLSPILTEQYVFSMITSGAADFLVKPVNETLLLQTLEKLERKINNED